MLCSNCGTEFVGKFCSNCGAVSPKFNPANEKPNATVTSKGQLKTGKRLQIVAIAVLILGLAGTATSFVLLGESEQRYESEKSDVVRDLEFLQNAEDDLQRKSDYAAKCISSKYTMFGCSGPWALPDVAAAQNTVKIATESARTSSEEALMAIEELEKFKLISVAGGILAALGLLSSAFLILYTRKLTRNDIPIEKLNA